jgi:threonyl-tRNA synthetase
MRRELWKVSGHEGFYSGNMYTPMELDDAEYRLKPMNCPGHILIYKNSPKSYRDLPQRYAELGNVYRYERSGTMHGLLRVRGFTQDDAHIFCTPQQIESEVAACIDFAEAVLKTFGFNEFKVELSTWDPNDRAITPAPTRIGTSPFARSTPCSRRKASPTRPSPAKPPSTAPKSTSSWSTSSAASGSSRRCSSTSICPRASSSNTSAKTASAISPSWCTALSSGPSSAFSACSSSTTPEPSRSGSRPCRSASCPSARSTHLRAKVEAELKAAGLRVETDARNEKMNSKIRDFANQKTPYILVFGDKEEGAGFAVSVRTRGKGDQGSMPLRALADFIAKATALVEMQSTEL